MPALIFFLVYLIAEIWLFTVMADEIGVSGVLLWILLTAVGGTVMIRAQGQHMIQQARMAVENRTQPVADAMLGLCAILGGVLLIMPGFLTDALGLAFALPGLRNITSGWLHQSMQQRAAGPFPGQSGHQSGHQNTAAGNAGANRDYQRYGSPPVIDGEFSVVEDGADDRADQSQAADTASPARPSGASATGSVPPYRDKRGD